MEKIETITSWNKAIHTWEVPFRIDKEGKMVIHTDWDSFENEHIFIMFELHEKVSYDMAVWADNNINDMFAYRDWTSSGIPFIENNEIHWSGFIFQKLKDAKKFQKHFGGSGNWMEGHDEFVKKCNEHR